MTDTALQQAVRLIAWLDTRTPRCNINDGAYWQAMRNMLPGLREMAEDWCIDARYSHNPDCGDERRDYVEALAQSILDAARGVLTPEQYAEAVRE